MGAISRRPFGVGIQRGVGSRQIGMLKPPPPTVYLWVGGNGYISKWRVSDGVQVGNYAVAVNGPINSVTFNGTNLLVYVGQNGYQKAAIISQTGSVLWGPGKDPPRGNSYGIAWDGYYWWFSDGSSNVRAYDSSMVVQYTGGVAAINTIFDGANVWTCRAGGNGIMYKFSTNPPAYVGSYTPTDVQYYESDNYHLCTDKTYVYRCSQNAAWNGLRFTKVLISDGTMTSYTPVATGDTYHSCCTDNAGHVYACIGSNLYKIRASDGTSLGSAAIGSGVTNPPCCCDGTYVYISRESSNYVTKIRCSDMTVMTAIGDGTFNTLHGPIGLCTTPNLLPDLPV